MDKFNQSLDGIKSKMKVIGNDYYIGTELMPNLEEQEQGCNISTEGGGYQVFSSSPLFPLAPFDLDLFISKDCKSNQIDHRSSPVPYVPCFCIGNKRVKLPLKWRVDNTAPGAVCKIQGEDECLELTTLDGDPLELTGQDLSKHNVTLAINESPEDKCLVLERQDEHNKHRILSTPCNADQPLVQLICQVVCQTGIQLYI